MSGNLPLFQSAIASALIGTPRSERKWRQRYVIACACQYARRSASLPSWKITFALRICRKCEGDFPRGQRCAPSGVLAGAGDYISLPPFSLRPRGADQSGCDRGLKKWEVSRHREAKRREPESHSAVSCFPASSEYASKRRLQDEIAAAAQHLASPSLPAG